MSSTGEGVWAAPGRVNLIGEHTDYNDGFVMPFALPHTTVATVSRRDDGVLRLTSTDMDGGPVELRVDDLAPGGPGGGDHLALNDLYELGLERWRTARLCQRAENVYVGAPTGIMDQTASACCTEGHALYLDTRDLSQRQIPFDLAAHGLELLVVDTRVKHAHSDGEYGKRRAGCEAGAAALGVNALRDVPYDSLDEALGRLDDPEVRSLVRHIVSENHRVERVIAHLEAGEVRAIGPVLTEGHASLRDDFRVSCRELDLVVDTALAAGALGARMTGGGFGGSAIVLTQTSASPLVAKSVEEAFAASSLEQPRVFTAVPSAGARRLS
jgi:galactokinase